MKHYRSLFVVCALAAYAPWVQGAEWKPTERMTFVSHSSAGTGNDVFMRAIADIWMKKQFVPRQITVENVTGARGEKARRYVAVQNKDNPHILISWTPSQLNASILTRSDLTFRNFVPLAIMATDPGVVFVHTDSPYKSLDDLIKAAAAQPKKILQGGGTFGSSGSMLSRMFATEKKVEFSYVPFKGGGEGVTNLLGKHIQFIVENPGEGDQHVKAGKFRVLAVTEKLPQWPDAPTFAELGYKFRPLKQFRGILAPPGVAREVADFYIRTLDRTRATPEWKEYVARTSLVEQWIAGRDLYSFMEEEEKIYQRLNREMGLMN